MIGDKLIIKDYHRRAAEGVFNLVWKEAGESSSRYVISVSGESGSGKSEIAAVLAEKFEAKGMKCYIFQQDDYFVYPPKTNEQKRRESISHVGVSEVRLDVLDGNLESFLAGTEEITKPLVIFEEDRMTEEKADLRGVEVALVEGTYTTLLGNVNTHVFIDRTYEDTKRARAERSREKQDAFLEEVLLIEHKIISKNKERADVIIDKDYVVKGVLKV